MTELAEESGKGSALTDLTLQVRQAGAVEQEVFLQHGLSLGRNASNTLCIDHPDVERIHAQVLRQADGTMMLECASGQPQILLADGTKVVQLILKPGATFKIGPATIRCLKRETRSAVVVTDNPWQVRCPRCHEIIANLPRDARECPACKAELFYFKQQPTGDAAADAAGFQGWLPRQIGPYQIRAFVAEGGMGIVLRGLHKDNDMPAAVKLLRGDAVADPMWKARFEAEIGTLVALKHPNVVRLQDNGQDSKLLWLAMDWVDGAPLSSWTARARAGNPIPIEQIRSAMSQVISGLQYLHGRQIIHRDLKPGNILVAQDDLVKMVDFGIARSAGGEASMATRLTQTGMVTGTESYMAPEQAEGRAVTTASDIYAVGVIWYELLTSRRPMGAFVAPELLRSDTPPHWSRLIGQCLSNDPRYRPSTDDLLRALSGAAAGPPPLQTPPGMPVAPVMRNQPTGVMAAPMSGSIPAHLSPPPLHAAAYAPASTASAAYAPPAYAPGQPAYSPGPPAYSPPNNPGTGVNAGAGGGTGTSGGAIGPMVQTAVAGAGRIANDGAQAVKTFLVKHPPKKWMQKLGPLGQQIRKNPKIWAAGGGVLIVIILILIIRGLSSGGSHTTTDNNTPDKPAQNDHPNLPGTNNPANPPAVDPRLANRPQQPPAAAALAQLSPQEMQGLEMVAIIRSRQGLARYFDEEPQYPPPNQLGYYRFRIVSANSFELDSPIRGYVDGGRYYNGQYTVICTPQPGGQLEFSDPTFTPPLR